MSGPGCSTCARSDLADVHRMVDTVSANAAAKHFKIPKATLLLHLKHREAPPAKKSESAKGANTKAPPSLPQGAASTVQQPEPVEPDLPLDDIDGRIRQLARTTDRLRVASENGSLRDRAASLNACRNTIEALVELEQKRALGREPELLTSKAWATTRGALVAALQPFPDAARAVGAALRELEDA